MVPPWRSMISRVMASPSPNPPVVCPRESSTRTNLSKIVSTNSGGIPGPSSPIVTIALPSDSLTANVTELAA